MSGPFINFAIIDKDNDRVLVLEGFSYSPSKEKRDLMLELEQIIRSVAVITSTNYIRPTPNKNFMGLQWKIKAFEELSVHELYDLLRLRRDS
jgi:hypothetical protein